MSVIIPVRNGERYLQEAIDSALAQTVPPLEIIVIDDASTDGTPEVIRSFGDSVRAIRVAAGGASRARNTGIRAARGTLIAFLDADDSWDPEKLARQLQRFDAQPELVMVFCGTSTVDEAGRWLSNTPCDPRCTGMAAAQVLRQKNCIHASTVLASRAALLEAGLFDVELPACETWELWIRLADRGPIDFVDAPLIRYRLHADNAIWNVDRMRAARLQVLERHHAERRGPAWRRALALAHLDSGIGYLELGRRRPAGRDLLHSLWIRPTVAVAIELVRLVLPTAVRRLLGRVRRQLHALGDRVEKKEERHAAARG